MTILVIRAGNYHFVLGKDCLFIAGQIKTIVKGISLHGKTYSDY